jgi:hypothetical protein
MRIVRRLLIFVAAMLVASSTPAVAQADLAAAPAPLLTGVRAAHHPGSDRVVFDFFGGVPSSRRLDYVSRLIADPRGSEIPVAGRTILQVRFEAARGHRNDGTDTSPNRVVFPLLNVLTVVQSGDFEGVVTYGIGLAKRQPYRVSTLANPPRVVVDIDTNFTTVQRRVWFFDRDAYVGNDEPFFRPVSRPVISTAPAHGLMDRLFAGPTASERTGGLRFLASGATDYSNLAVSNEVARVRLRGGCSSGGSTVSIAGEIMPTLRQLANVSWVKIYDPAGTTERPTGRVDSIPECLEP